MFIEPLTSLVFFSRTDYAGVPFARRRITVPQLPMLAVETKPVCIALDTSERERADSRSAVADLKQAAVFDL